MPRILFANYHSYLDNSNGAAVASRAMMESFKRHAFDVHVLTSTMLDPAGELGGLSLPPEFGVFKAAGSEVALSNDPSGLRNDRLHSRDLVVNGVPLTLYNSPTTRSHEPGHSEIADFLALLDSLLDRFEPDILVNYGGDLLAHHIRSRGQRKGATVVFPLHNFGYHVIDTFFTVDRIIVPSEFAARFYKEHLDLECTVLPNLVDHARAFAADREPRYVTFVNPSYEKGVYAFARIADELGRSRPDIPLLVVEGRGTEQTLVDCGIDLRRHGNISLMGHTSDPRQFWSLTRICIMPSLWLENQPLVAVEAMINGIPVISSDRGGAPETLGSSGTILPLPDHLTPDSRSPPGADEIGDWVRAIVELWDDPRLYREASLNATLESRRWRDEVLEPEYLRFFRDAAVRIRAGGGRPGRRMRARAELGHYLNGLGLLGVGAEIGVQSGFFSRAVLDSWRGNLIYLVDIWQQCDGYVDPANVSSLGQVERMIHTIRHVSPYWERVRVIQEFSDKAACLVPDESLDWVYIDANHNYESVKRDLEIWYPKVKAGGLVAGHDFLDGNFVIRGVNTLFGVKRAVSEFFAGISVESTEEEFPTWYVQKPHS